MKILNWIFRKYLRKHLSKRLIVLRNRKFIPDIEIVESTDDVLSRYQDRIIHELAMEIVKQRLINTKRRRNDEFGGEDITAEIYIFKSQKKGGELDRVVGIQG